MFLINGRQNLPAERLRLPSLRYSLHCDTVVTVVSETEPTLSPTCACIRNQGPLEKWLVPELGQEKYKRSPGHLVEAENKEVLKMDGLVERTQEAT